MWTGNVYIVTQVLTIVTQVLTTHANRALRSNIPDSSAPSLRISAQYTKPAGSWCSSKGFNTVIVFG